VRGLVLWMALLSSALAAPPGVDPAEGVPEDPSRAGPDRSRPPPVAPPVPLDLPPIQRVEARPGLTLHHRRVPGLRQVRVDVLFRRGARQLDGGPSAPVTAMAWAWDQETRATDAEALAVYEATHDVDVWSLAQGDTIAVRLEAPLGTLDEGLDLLSEVVRTPRFRRRDTRLLSTNMLRSLLEQGPSRSDVVLDAALRGSWYPAGHPLRGEPDAAGWRDLRPVQLRRRHEALLAQAPVDVVVVSDCPRETLAPRVLTALEGIGVPGELPTDPPVEPPEADRITGVAFGQADQAVVGLRLPAPPQGHPDAAAMQAIDHALGGTFLSRLNAELREARGLTYGVGSTWEASPVDGHLTIQLETAAEDVGEVVDVIEEILADLRRDGLTRQEIDDAHALAVSGWNDTLRTVDSAARSVEAAVLRGRTPDLRRARLDALSTLTPEQTREVARRWLGEDRPHHWVVIGDRSVLDEILASRGRSVDWVPGELVVLGAW
jgi:zinc protease